jgi:hypothetical protein
MGAFGVEADDVADILKEVQIKAREALADADPTTGYGESFARLGISLDDLRPRVGNASELLQFFTEQLNQSQDMALRSFVIDELFSDAGTRATQFFNQGSAAIRRQRQEQERQAGSTIRLAHKMQTVNRVLRTGARAWEDLWATLALKYLPKFIEIMEKSDELIKIIKELTVNTNFLEQAFTAIGVAAAVAAGALIASWVAAIGPIGLAILGVTALFLLFDDMKAAIKGDRSALKDFLDETLGLEKSKATITFFRDTWKLIGEYVEWVANNIRRPVNFLAGLFGAEGPIMRGDTNESRGFARETFRGGRSIRRFAGRASDALGFGNIAETGVDAGIIHREIREEREMREAERRALRDEELSRAALAAFPEIEIANLEETFGAPQTVMRSGEFVPAGQRGGLSESQVSLLRSQGLAGPVNIEAPMSVVLNIASDESSEAIARNAIDTLEERENERLNRLQGLIPENRP